MLNFAVVIERTNTIQILLASEILELVEEREENLFWAH